MTEPTRTTIDDVFTVLKMVVGAGLIIAVLTGAAGATEQVQWIASSLAAILVFLLNQFGYLPARSSSNGT